MKAISGSELQRPQMSLTVECRFAYVCVKACVCVHVNHSVERGRCSQIRFRSKLLKNFNAKKKKKLSKFSAASQVDLK